MGGGNRQEGQTAGRVGLTGGRPRFGSLAVRDRTLDLSSPVVMGILNVTPDSFSDGGRFLSPDAAVERIGTMISEGAAIIDIGGESTRPGSDRVSAGEEIDRVIPVLEKGITAFPDAFFSIDTTKYGVAEEALRLGVHIVNDVSGLQKEPRLAELCVRSGAALVLMHSKGDPKTMQQDPSYDDVVDEIYGFFVRQSDLARSVGLENLILDPGIGFGKTVQHNLEILRKMDRFRELGHPLLLGASRKSMIGQLLGGRPVDGRLAGTLAVHCHALMAGTHILRVHDIREAKDTIMVYNAIAGRG